MKTVMVVDDEKNIRDSLEGVLKDEGYAVVTAETAEKAVDKLRLSSPDAVLLDIWLPGMDGIEALKTIRETHPDVPVVMISGHGNIETAVKATKMGAYDFLEKPLSLEKVVLTIGHAVEHKRLMGENAELIERARNSYEIIGASRGIEELKLAIKKAAPADSSILITGENGTGKELVARNIHLFSNRSSRPFVAVNCAAIPEELIESELFGHEKGAFTSAIASKKGKFDMADGGTLFLDEIGDMSLKTQAKVLRVLQDMTFERVGGTKTITVDVRVVAATNKNLEYAMKKGEFREDLFYRLNVIPFHVPPLRERRDDISVFMDRFIEEFSLQTGRIKPGVSEEAKRAVLAYDWPGNVRELKNLMERLIIMNSSGVITADELPDNIRYWQDESRGVFVSGTLKDARNEFEREFIKKKLAEFGGNVSKAADALGIERSHLYRKIKSYGIDVE